MLMRSASLLRRISRVPPALCSSAILFRSHAQAPALRMGAKLSSPAQPSKINRQLSGNAFSSLKEPVPAQSQDPCSYTAGRFLNQDELQRDARHVQFDFSRLCEVAVRLSDGATQVVSHEKKEGGYSKVFILTFDTGKRLVARIPTQVAGAPRLTTNSEVATIAYLLSKTSIPLPNVLAWSDDPANPVGAEYIIQEHVNGVLLHEQWPGMDTVQHQACTKHLSLKIPEMAALNFSAFGNIYFADAPIDASLKVPLQEDVRFCIGPYCSPLFWNRGVGEAEMYGEPSPNRGPWNTLSEYTAGLVSTALSRIPKQPLSEDKMPYRGSPEEHIRLLGICRETMQKLANHPRIQEAAKPTMIHADYNKRNIFVSREDPTIITGIIDWQHTCIEPAFIFAHMIPDFASLPDIDPSEDENASKTREEESLLKDLSICYQTFDVVRTLKTPKLRPGKLMDQTYFRLFHYCYTSWRDGIPAIRQELLDLKELWPQLEEAGLFPYNPTAAELAEHKRQYEDFESAHKLRAWLKMALQTTSDGWVPNEVWDAAKEANQLAYQEWMETAREAVARGDEGMTMEKAEKLWPFDAR